MGPKYIAGVSFEEGAAQLAVLELRREQVTVVHMEEVKGGKSGDMWFLQGLLDRRAKILRKVSKVSVALDCGKVLLHSFPLDNTLSGAEQREQVRWELANLRPDLQPEDQVNDVHILESHTQDHWAQMFVVSAPRSYLQEIQRVLRENNYMLHLVDTNHFAGQYALSVNYPETKEKSIVLASIGEGRVDMGMLCEGRLTSYRYAVTGSLSEQARHLAEFVRERPVEEVYTFGGGCTFDFTKELRTLGVVKITKTNPFRRVSLSSPVREAGMTLGQEHRFVACVGVALRKE
jgi:hypothetical protein